MMEMSCLHCMVVPMPLALNGTINASPSSTYRRMSVKGVCQWGVSGMCQRCVRGVSEGIIEDMIWYDTRIGGWRNVPLSYQHMKFLLDNHRIVQICIDIHVKRVSGGQGQRGDRKLKFAPRHFQKELHVGLDGAVVGDLQGAG